MATELEAMELCREYSQQRLIIDYYATTIFASIVAIFGAFGNAATLLTLSGRRLATATFVYYRTIAEVDLCRCIFVFTYVLRVLIPFRRHYWTTWYEAHFMYFAISTLGFISTSLAVFLCFRLCTGIVKSTRLKKTKTDPQETRKVIYCVVAAALFVNVWLCFEYEVMEVYEDICTVFDVPSSGTSVPLRESLGKNRTVEKKYSLAPSQFNFRYSMLLKAIHNIPTVILLILLGGTICLLILSVFTLPGLASGRNRPSILTDNNTSLQRSKPWRTQRQLCNLFIFLSVSYGFGLLPSLLHYALFGTDVESISNTYSAPINDSERHVAVNWTVQWQDQTNGTLFYDSLDEYENQLADLSKRQVFATVMNVFQNFAHALSFYVYAACSEAFRNEFLIKSRQVINRLVLACPCIGFLVYTPILPSNSSHLLAQDVVMRNATARRNDNEPRRGNVRKYHSTLTIRKVLLSERDDNDERMQVAATVL